MTAVLDEIRQLEAARNRGDMDEFAFRAAKAELMNAIEDASEASSQAPKNATPPPMPLRSRVWQIVFFSVVAFVLFIGVAAMILGDTTLALTIAAVILAAITVQAFRSLED